jgi:hypothetical protein
MRNLSPGNNFRDRDKSVPDAFELLTPLIIETLLGLKPCLYKTALQLNAGF